MDHCPACGYVPDKPKGKPRSVPQHRRYFALCRSAFMHWPESNEFKPSSEEHLRRWLQCKAGYHTVQTIDLAGSTPEQAVALAASAMKNAGEHPFVKSAGTRLYVFQSQSVNFDELPHLKACDLFDAVAEIIEAETGIRVDDMITHTPRKSAREPMVTA